MFTCAALENIKDQGVTVSEYYPGAVRDVVGLHIEYYAQDWGFGLPFETKVAAELSAFLQRYNPDHHLFVTLRKDGQLIGTVSVDGDDPDGAHLRWFVMSDRSRGMGLGNLLMQVTLDFCSHIGVQKAWFTTFAGLDAARHLYEKYKFQMVSETPNDQWDGGVTERRYEQIFAKDESNA